MKRKLLCVLLAALIAALLCVPAFAAGISLTYDLTSDGVNAVTVPAGSDVTVTFTVKASAGYSLNSIQNVITYDKNFLTVKSKSAAVGSVAEGKTLSSNTVKFSDMTDTYLAEQIVGTVVFTVKSDATGSTILRSTETGAYDSSGDSMNITMQDLTITVGTPTPPTVPVTGVTLSPKPLTLTVGDSQTLSASVLPADATNKALSWSSDHPAIASVDASGTVTAVSTGSATITAIAEDGSGIYDTVAVTVEAATVPVTAVSLSKNTLSLNEGSSETLIASVLPDNATNKAVTWSSSAPSVASVNAGGVVTAVAEGTATITVTTEDGGKTDVCAVTVSKPSSGGGMAAPEKLKVTASSSSGGTITPSGVRSVKPGDSITFRMTANKGCTLKAVYVDGKDVGALSEYTFKDVQEVHTIYASFYDPNGSSYKDCPRDENCPIEPFDDTINDFWWHDGIHYCVESGLMKGVAEKLFDPNGTTTRAMIVTILWRMEGNPVTDYAMSFRDVPASQWYTEAIRWAQSTGVVSGYDDVTFGPGDNITREQLATILYRYAKYKGYDVSDSSDLAGFTDAKNVSSWALAGVKWANCRELVNGRTASTLIPLGNATRAEAAAMIQRFCENIVK